MSLSFVSNLISVFTFLPPARPSAPLQSLVKECLCSIRWLAFSLDHPVFSPPETLPVSSLPLAVYPTRALSQSQLCLTPCLYVLVALLPPHPPLAFLCSGFCSSSGQARERFLGRFCARCRNVAGWGKQGGVLLSGLLYAPGRLCNPSLQPLPCGSGWNPRGSGASLRVTWFRIDRTIKSDKLSMRFWYVWRCLMP